MAPKRAKQAKVAMPAIHEDAALDLDICGVPPPPADHAIVPSGAQSGSGAESDSSRQLVSVDRTDDETGTDWWEPDNGGCATGCGQKRVKAGLANLTRDPLCGLLHPAHTSACFG